MSQRSRLSAHSQGFYLLCLFGFLTVYNLALKITRVAAHPDVAGTWQVLRSDLLFNLGFATLWVALALRAWRSRLRWPVLVAMHVSCLLYAIITTGAHRYFDATGTVLDFGLVVFAFANFAENRVVMASETPWVQYGLVLGYLCVGPFLLTEAARRGRPPAGTHPSLDLLSLLRRPLGPLGAVLCVLPVISARANLDSPFARDPVVQLIATAPGRDLIPGEGDAAAPRPPIDVELERRDRSRPLNAVVIILESTGASATTLHSPELPTTPFLADLAGRGLVVERAYSTIPHTSKALISILCGIEPRPIRELTEVLPGLVPATCLPELLETEGYRTVFFQSATERFERRGELVANFGYRDFFAGESMDADGFERANYFAYEDAVMLETSRRWLSENGSTRFFATYLTATPHHDYLAPRRYGRLELTEDDEHNRYLNSVRYLDFFVRDLLDQFRELGLLGSTVFIIVGDHGEAFGEHGRRKHDDVLYEEVVRVPFLVLDPRNEQERRVSGPASLLDVLPTLVDALGFDVVDSSYPGESVFRIRDPGRTLYFNCFNHGRCRGQLEGTRKFIHYYDEQADELFDLANDPFERHNLASTESPAIGRLRARLRESWQSVDLMYRRHHRMQIDPFLSEREPPVEKRLGVSFGDRLELVGVDLSTERLRRGESFSVSYHFHVKTRLPKGWRMVVEGEGPTGRESAEVGHEPFDGLYRLRFWKPGSYVTDVQQITVPAEWSSNTFNVFLSFFDKGSESLVDVASHRPSERKRVLVASLAIVD
ncbi:MAG TPA: sulfatase-like hydrolase/transferase [Vicinamibacteria bacterium]|nr:sulfatase-like hydrolase/transferase [Vicinamibacteria bacterium]